MVITQWDNIYQQQQQQQQWRDKKPSRFSNPPPFLPSFRPPWPHFPAPDDCTLAVSRGKHIAAPDSSPLLISLPKKKKKERKPKLHANACVIQAKRDSSHRTIFRSRVIFSSIPLCPPFFWGNFLLLLACLPHISERSMFARMSDWYLKGEKIYSNWTEDSARAFSKEAERERR